VRGSQLRFLLSLAAATVVSVSVMTLLHSAASFPAAEAPLAAQAAPPQAPVNPLESPRPARGVYPATVPDDDEGFVKIFDGQSLKGWDGDTSFWRVEDGAIVGETTPEKALKQNTFLIWRGGVVKNFELKVEYRLSGVNSGIQYRSSEVPSVGKWTLKGYQADIDGGGDYTGNIHDERGRAPQGEGHAVLSRRGEVTRDVAGPGYKVLGTIGDPAALFKAIKPKDWNAYHIIARGPVLMQLINGQLMAVALDEDTAHAPAEGLLGLQLHTGPPFKIEYRNVRYRALN
jgi:3-keto-disaccharide hydrolase